MYILSLSVRVKIISRSALLMLNTTRLGSMLTLTFRVGCSPNNVVQSSQSGLEITSSPRECRDREYFVLF